MATSNRAVSTYVEQEILSESPLARVARLYEMASLELSRARAALAADDARAKGRAVGRLARCLGVLQASLNRDKGGEVATNLDRIYAYLLRRLSEAHARNDDAAFGEIARHLGELGTAWREIAERPGTAPPKARAEELVAAAR